jgi:menaquinone-dependent protoporphyrinogen oxidase
MVLVSAASRHGATREIASAIADGLERCGVDALAVPIEHVEELEGYDAVVLGSAVYMGHWLEPAIRLAEGVALAGPRPVWLFSSGPIGSPDPLPHDEAVDVARLLEATAAHEHRVFAGRLDRKLLKFRERAVVAALHVQEGDFRDWDAIDAWAGEIAEALG